ncbi:MAG: cell wall-binding repeat-containing protein, partial [Coriobacteriia bacterium]|nr:cell wall-binding repeat-containing protein [Coriobacteriia bacterium]
GAAPGDAASVVVPSVPGVYTLEFWAKDAAGNTEAPANTVSFRVGSEVIKIPPVSTCDAKRSYVDSATITITASSANGSGIGFITYILDGGQPVVVDGDIAIVIVSSEETHTLEFWATDKDNNEEISHNMVTFEVVSEGMHGGSIIRVYGADRYETGLDASRRNFNKAEAVIIATGANYADALSASALAGSLKAPLLLTKPDTLSPGVLGEIKRLEAKKAYIMGSTAAVSQGVEASLKDAGLNIERIGGPDRYATSAEVAKKVAVLEGPGFAKKVLLARGDDFADGLSGSPLAYINKIPVLLTRPTALSTYASDVIIGLEVRDVTVLGSTAAVSAGVEDSVRGIDTSPTVRRVAGANRYETAQEIATYAFTNSLATKRFLGVATGQNFPDALTGGVATGERGGVLILTTNSTLSSNWLSYLPSTYAGIKPDIQVYGGSNVVTDGVMSTLQGLLLD